MTSDPFAEALAALAAFPVALRTQVAGLSRAALTYRPAENEWSVIENIGHLIDIDVLFAGRIGQIITRDNPTFTVLDVDVAVRQHDYQGKEAAFLLNSFAERRAAMIDEWRYIQPANRKRTGLHPTGGPRSIEELVLFIPRHDLMHRDQIAATIAAFEQAG